MAFGFPSSVFEPLLYRSYHKLNIWEHLNIQILNGCPKYVTIQKLDLKKFGFQMNPVNPALIIWIVTLQLKYK